MCRVLGGQTRRKQQMQSNLFLSSNQFCCAVARQVARDVSRLISQLLTYSSQRSSIEREITKDWEGYVDSAGTGKDCGWKINFAHIVVRQNGVGFALTPQSLEELV